MEYKMEAKPFIQKDGVKYKTIQVTDITLHSDHLRVTANIGDKIKKAFDINRAGRFYEDSVLKDVLENQRKYILEKLSNDPSFREFVLEEERNGYKILLDIPKEGVPVLAGKDTVEFLNSKNGKRVLRGLAKEKRED